MSGRRQAQPEGKSVSPRRSVGREEIHIVIDTNGNITLETKGVEGAQCDRLSGSLESALGDVIDRINKDEYERC